MEKKQREKEKTSHQTTKDEDKMTMKRPPTPNPLFNEVFRELEHAAGEKELAAALRAHYSRM